MSVSIATGIILAVALCVAIPACFLAARLARYPRPDKQQAAEPWNFSLARYEPMKRLMGQEDLEFLRAETPGSPLAREWRHTRRRIFRLYLSELASDFLQLHR